MRNSFGSSMSSATVDAAMRQMDALMSKFAQAAEAMNALLSGNIAPGMAAGLNPVIAPLLAEGQAIQSEMARVGVAPSGVVDGALDVDGQGNVGFDFGIGGGLARLGGLQARGSDAYERDILSYDIPAARSEGEMERERSLPFGGGNLYGLDLEAVNLNRGQIGALTERRGRLKASGELSEEAELRLMTEIERLKMENAGMVGELGEGMENRLPELSAGSVASFHRHDSLELAAMRLYEAGSPRGAYGAINGAQAQRQADFVDGFGAPGPGSHSRTQGMNSGDERVVRLLERIANALERMGSSSSGNNRRIGEAMGVLAGALSQKNFGPNSVPGTN